MRTTIAIVLLAALTACSTRVAGEPRAAAPVDAPAAPTATPSAAAGPAEQHGNAATNKVCQLVTAEEVERLTGYAVWQVHGLEPGFRGDLTCVWRLTAVDYGAPAFSIAWDETEPSAPEQAEYFRTLIENGDRDEVQGFGDVATTDGTYINIISGDDVIAFNYRVHQVASRADADVHLALLRLAYPRMNLT
ncbi:hypothetical protein GCM10023148_21320 [Actinokineospora soli]